MKILPELRVAAPYTPAHNDALEVFRRLGVLHVLDELRHIAGRDVEHEVGVAAHHPGIDGQAVEARLVAVGLANHERHVAVRAVAQQAVNHALAVAALDTQHGCLG
ncbi:hypothetical protein D9M73_248020 [compost metagenome]